MPHEADVPILRGADDLAIESCTLDQAARARQEERYRNLSASVSQIERSAGTIAVVFDRSLDSALLEQTLAVERDCCSFFQLDFDAHLRRLTITVSEVEQRPALEALEAALRHT